MSFPLKHHHSFLCAGAAALASSVLLLAGCSMGTIALSGPEPGPAAVSVHMNGSVFGGRQPIVGSTLQLYAVGSGSYGATASPLIASTKQEGGVGSVSVTAGGNGYSTPTVVFTGGGGSGAAATATTAGGVITGVTVTSAGSGYTSAPAVSFSGGAGATATALLAGSANALTDASGAFSITGDYICPTPTSTIVYLVATGGNTGAATNNTAAVLVAPLGPCSGLSAATNVTVNEVTTAATAFAMGQYFTTTFGAASTDSFGAPTSTQAQTGITNAYNTVANLVSVSDGLSVASATLTNSVGTVTVTPEFTKLNTIADVLAACVNSTGPGSSSCSTLFADVTPTGGTTPTDTLQAAVDMSLNPTSNNANGSTANITALYGLASATPPFPGLSAQPTDWTLGVTYGSNSVVAGAGDYLLDYPTYLAVDAGGNVWVANDYSSTTAASNSLTELSPTGSPVSQELIGDLFGPAGIAIDPSGNVFVPNYGSSTALQTSVVEYTVGGATNTFTTNVGPQRIAIDGQGNTFVLEPSYKGLGDLEEIPAGSPTATTATTLAINLTTDFSNLAIDSNYTVWVTGGGTGSEGGTTGYPYVYQFLYTAGPAPNYATTPNATTNVGGIAEPEQAIAVDNSNDVFVQNYGAETEAAFGGTTTVAAVAGSPFTTGATSLTKPEFQVTDGAGNLWVTNAAATTASPAGSIYEISNAGTNLSPSTGFAHTYDEPYGIAVDPSGNVWVGAYSASASATKQAFITEIVGAAVPVVTPIAAGLPATPGGTNKLGTRP